MKTKTKPHKLQPFTGLWPWTIIIHIEFNKDKDKDTSAFCFYVMPLNHLLSFISFFNSDQLTSVQEKAIQEKRLNGYNSFFSALVDKIWIKIWIDTQIYEVKWWRKTKTASNWKWFFPLLYFHHLAVCTHLAKHQKGKEWESESISNSVRGKTILAVK